MNFPLATKPWPHQQEGFDFAFPLDAAMLAAGMGCGKSLTAEALLAAWNCRHTLVLCPASVRSVWRREFTKHYPAMGVIVLDRKSVSKRTEDAADAINRMPGPLAIVLNYEAASLPPMASWILSQRWDAVICDESHLAGMPSDQTRTSRFIASLTPISDRRICLSGTPLANQPLRAFGQYRFLDPRIFGSDYAAFAKRYGAPKQLRLRKRLKQSRVALAAAIADCYGADSPLLDEVSHEPDYSEILPGIQHTAEFEDRIRPITWRCKSADVLDLPPLITEIREVDLTREQQRVYGGLWQHLYADLGNGDACTINAPLTLATRWQQITSGFLGTDRSGIFRFPDNPKRDALRDLLREAGEPTIVFCRYVADLATVEDVAKELGLRYGELSHRRKDAVTNLATLADGIDVAGVQPQSGGVGIDLSRAKIGIWYSLANRLPEYDQAIARLHRPGTTGCRLYSLVASDSIDADIHAAIADRRDVVEAILSRVQRKSY